MRAAELRRTAPGKDPEARAHAHFVVTMLGVEAGSAAKPSRA